MLTYMEIGDIIIFYENLLFDLSCKYFIEIYDSCSIRYNYHYCTYTL